MPHRTKEGARLQDVITLQDIIHIHEFKSMVQKYLSIMENF